METYLSKAIKKILLLVRKVIYKIKSFSLFIDHLAAKFLHPIYSSNQVQFEKKYRDPSEKMLCIFSHFDMHGIVDEYVLNYIEELKNSGYSIVFVTTSPKAPFISQLANTEQRLSQLIDKLVIRKNLGRDFGSYYIGINGVELNQFDYVLFANDSVYGPFKSIKDDINKMKDFDVWGYTDSWDANYHIQSYFFAIKIHSKTLEVLNAWQKNFLFYRAKGNVINHGELKLTKEFTSKNLTAGAIYPFDLLPSTIYDIRKAIQNRGNPCPQNDVEYYVQKYFDFLVGKCNPTHYYWLIFIVMFKFPFIKRELIEKNPLNLPFVYNWQRTVSEEFSINTEVYLNHQKRIR